MSKPPPSLERLIRERNIYAPDVGEMERILALPRRSVVGPSVVEDVSKKVLVAKEYEVEGYRLWETQAASLLTYAHLNGLFAPVGVGRGKAGISMLLADHAYRHKNIQRVLLLIPAGLEEQTRNSVYPEWRKLLGMAIPFIPIAHLGKKARQTWAESQRPGLYVCSYQVLSRTGGLELLQALRPGLVIADEAHFLANEKAGVTKRFFYWIRTSSYTPHFAAMSGTMTKRSLKDYHHLCSLALGSKSPLPLAKQILAEWAEFIDATAESDLETPLPFYARKTMQPLLTWAGKENLRAAFAERINSAPGVVATGDIDLGTSLRICTVQDVPAPGARLKELIAGVAKGMTPDGDPIAFAMHRYRWNWQLSCGFYMSLKWPTEEELMARYKWDLAKAADALQVAKDEHALSSMLTSELRTFLKLWTHSIATPFEVETLIAQGSTQIPDQIKGLHARRAKARAISKEKFGRVVERDSVFVPVDDFKIKAAVAWAKEHKKGLIWTFHRGVALWLLDELRKAGMDPADCGRGQSELISSIGDPSRKGKGDRLAVASTPAHQEGKNLQAWHQNLFLEWEKSASDAEQAIGRTHRSGQKADEVFVHRFSAVEFDDINFGASLNDAAYVQESLLLQQKLLFATYTHPPKVYPSSFLAAQGASPKRLSPAMAMLLARRFSSSN